MEDYRKIAIELGQTLISKAPETRKDVERMLPELKESEDERIRKAIINYLRQRLDRSPSIPAAIGYWIDWLEKQGETSPIFSNSSNIGKDEQKPVWSEEDEEIKKKVMHSLSFDGRIDNAELTDIYNWLNSFKERVQPQNRWKPSDEQLFELECVVKQNKDNMLGKNLQLLLEQLKNLK